MQTSNGLGVSDGQTINPAALSSCMSCPSSRVPSRSRKERFRRSATQVFLYSDLDVSLSQSVLTSNLTALANQTITPDTSPRGVKRSRSPDPYGDHTHSDHLVDDGMLFLS
jgi:hypothetical protein